MLQFERLWFVQFLNAKSLMEFGETCTSEIKCYLVCWTMPFCGYQMNRGWTNTNLNFEALLLK